MKYYLLLAVGRIVVVGEHTAHKRLAKAPRAPDRDVSPRIFKLFDKARFISKEIIFFNHRFEFAYPIRKERTKELRFRVRVRVRVSVKVSLEEAFAGFEIIIAVITETTGESTSSSRRSGELRDGRKASHHQEGDNNKEECKELLHFFEFEV
jgi:hypothetical protein